MTRQQYQPIFGASEKKHAPDPPIPRTEKHCQSSRARPAMCAPFD